jgi:hypothetical protein
VRPSTGVHEPNVRGPGAKHERITKADHTEFYLSRENLVLNESCHAGAPGLEPPGDMHLHKNNAANIIIYVVKRFSKNVLKRYNA